MIVVVPKGGEQETVDEGSNQCLVSEALVAVPGMGSIARRTAWPEQRARVLFCGALSRHRAPVRAEEGSVGRGFVLPYDAPSLGSEYPRAVLVAVIVLNIGVFIKWVVKALATISAFVGFAQSLVHSGSLAAVSIVGRTAM